jgi:hypothetical protein
MGGRAVPEKLGRVPGALEVSISPQKSIEVLNRNNFLSAGGVDRLGYRYLYMDYGKNGVAVRCRAIALYYGHRREILNNVATKITCRYSFAAPGPLRDPRDKSNAIDGRLGSLT